MIRPCKASFLAILAILLFTDVSSAGGGIFGTITEDGKPIAQGVKIQIQCGSTDSGTAETDQYGSYRIFLRQVGKCTLTLDYKGQKPSITIYLFSRPVRYDFVLLPDKGQYVIRRK